MVLGRASAADLTAQGEKFLWRYSFPCGAPVNSLY